MTCIHFLKPRHMFRVAVEVAERHIATFVSLLFYEMWYFLSCFCCMSWFAKG